MTRSPADSCTFYTRYGNIKTEIVMSVHVDDVFAVGRWEKLKNIEKIINLKFNIKEYRRVKKFLRVYY